MSPSTAPSPHSEYDALLAGRLRAGAGLVALSIVLFGANELLARRAPLDVFFAVKTVQLAAVALVWSLLRRPRSRAIGIALGLAFTTEVWITLALSGVLTGEVASAPLLFIVFVTASGTLLPWGGLAQLATVGIAGAAVAANLVLVPALPDGFGYTAIAAALAGVASVYVAFELDRTRSECNRAEAGERESVSALRDEVLTSEASARVAGVMLDCLDTPVLLDRLCTLTTEVLDCEESRTYQWDAPTSSLVLVAADRGTVRGGQAEHLATSVATELRSHLGSDDVACVSGALADRLLPGSTVVLALPLRRGERLVGLHIAGRAAPRVFSGVERRTARGIGQTVCVALLNAHLVAELSQAHRAKTDFVATLSHELRTPINAVLGFAEMAEDADGETRPESLRRVRQAAHDVLQLVEQTLEIGRLETGRDEVRTELVVVAELWDELGATSARFPRRPGVELDWHPAAAGVVVQTDPRKLTILVKNLVSNALKFTEHGTVRAALEASSRELVIQVADTGMGIRPEDQAAIFEMFRQVGDGRRTAAGTGLGLHIVKRFVEQLGGRIAVASTPGVGTVFTVTLTVARRRPSSAIDAA